MRALIISDVQADSYDRLSTITSEGTTSRLEDIISAFDAAVLDGIKRGCDTCILLGDIFDNRVALTLPVLDRMCRAVERASKHMRVRVLAGNHDSYLRSPAINSLRAFSGFAHIYDDGVVILDSVAFIPWADRGAPALFDRAEHLGARYVLGHLLVQGAAHASVGVPPAELRPERFARVILGDVHAPIDIKPNISYVGALLPLNFGDSPDSPRGWAIFDSDSGDFCRVQNTESPRFYSLAPGEWPKSIRNKDFVRITGEPSPEQMVRVERMRTAGAWVEAVASPPEVLNTPRISCSAVDDDRTLLQKYMAHQGVDDPTILERGVEILSAVRGRK